MKYSVCKLLVCSMAVVVSAASWSFESKPDVPYKGERYPTFAQPNEVWCLVTIKPEFKTVSEQVMVKPATCGYETIPATFENRTERVMSKPASCRFEVIPAVYENRSEQVCATKESKRCINTPATYNTEHYDVTVSPSRTEWRKVDCVVSTNEKERKDDCYALVTIPAQIKTCSREVICTPASVSYETIPATFRTVNTRVMVKPEIKNRIEIPAEFCNVEKRVCVTNESKRKFEIPAVYETREKQVCGTPERKVWRLSDCAVPVVAAQPKGDCNACPTAKVKKADKCNTCEQSWFVPTYDADYRVSR
jgi:hypothetical protein